MPKKLSKHQKQSQKSIDKLVTWAENKGYDVIFSGNSCDELRRIHKEVHICIRAPLEYQLIGLAHECGHLLIQHNHEHYQKRYPRSYEREIEGNKSRQWSRVSLHQEIAEECEAWHKAQEILERLNISYDQEKFDKVAADCIFTYIKTAAE